MSAQAIDKVVSGPSEDPEPPQPAAAAAIAATPIVLMSCLRILNMWIPNGW
ncbi:hypothetical protein GCM10010399_07810 [Dactylosporangium fulvum]